MGKPYSLSTIINAIYDETTRALKTTASFTGTLEVHLDKDNDSVTIYGNDGVVNRVMKTDADGHIQADILSSALPTGAATESKQDDTIVQLQRIAGLTDTDFATSAKQDTSNSWLQQLAGLTQTIPGVTVHSPSLARYGSAAGEVDEPRIDASTNSIQTITYEHHEIHGGSHYFVRGYQDLTINQVLDFTWLMPDTTKWIHWTWDIDTESETLWQVYENVVATNPLANAIIPLNSNRNSANTSGTTMKFEKQTNLAAANADTDVSGGTLISSGISGAGKESGMAIRANELVLDQGVLYCLRATASAAGYINFNMNWYEHTDKH